MAETFGDLFFGYSVIFLIICVFVFRIAAEQNKLRCELEQLKAEKGRQ